jgi:hypothetical protein
MDIISNNIDILNKIVEYFKNDNETLYKLIHISSFFRQTIKNNNLLPSIWKIICHKNLLIDARIKTHQISCKDQIKNINAKIHHLNNLIILNKDNKEEIHLYLKNVNKNKKQLKITQEEDYKLYNFANKKNPKIRFCQKTIDKDIDLLYVTYSSYSGYIYIKELYINSNSRTIHTNICPNCREGIHCKKAIEPNELFIITKYINDIKFCSICCSHDEKNILDKLKEIY